MAHAMWSCDGFQNSIHSKCGGIPFQMFQSGEGIPRKAATFGVGRVLLCPGCHTGTPWSLQL